MNLCATILAGGKSSRMGTDKALLKLGNATVIEYIIDELYKLTDNILIVSNKPSDYEFLNLPIVSDRYHDKGPLAGIETAMYHTSADYYLLSACDTPFIKKEVLQLIVSKINSSDAVIPKYLDKLHPLSGMYNRSILSTVQQQLQTNNLSIRSIFNTLHVEYIQDFSGINQNILNKHFFNMNNPDEFNKATHMAN